MPMLQCPDCRGEIRDLQCLSCHSAFAVRDDVPVLLPRALDALKHDEAEYHDHFDEDAAEVHQLGTVRNEWYHRIIVENLQIYKFAKLPVLENDEIQSPSRRLDLRILEVGGGSGYDAEAMMKRGAEVVVTDISSKTLARTRDRLLLPTPYSLLPPIFVAADAESLPFADASFDAAYAVAVVHHMPAPDRAVAEMARVVKPGGRVVVGMEPNATYFRAVRRLRPLLCRAVGQSPHEGSRADAEMGGFAEKELRRAFANAGLAVERVIPVWLTLGFLHYGLEFLHRALRLRRRIVVPRAAEWILLAIDRVLFLIPGMRRLGWHWIVVGRK